MAWQVNANLRVYVEVAFGKDPMSDKAAGTWTDITAYCRTLSTSRGRSSVFQSFDPGRLSVTLSNNDARFDPGNSSSPYNPDLIVGLPIRFRVTNGDGSTSHTQFVGFVERFDLGYPAMGVDAIVSLTATEDIALLASRDLVGNYAAQATGARIDDVLDEVGWPTGGSNRSVDTGVANVRAINFAEGGGESAIAHLRNVAACEQGEVFQTGAGVFEFFQRAATLGSSVATFGETAATQIVYNNIVPVYDRDQLLNQVTARSGENDIQEALDATSIANHGPSHGEIGGGHFATDNEALNSAEFAVLRRKDVVRRVREVSVQPVAQSTAALQLLAASGGIDLRSKVTVQYDPPGSGSTINQDSFVESISHSLSPSPGDWTVTYGVVPRSAAEATSYWVLGTSTLGTGTVLA